MSEDGNQYDQIAPAKRKAQAALKSVPKRGENPHFRSKYATLDDIIEAVTPVLSKHALHFTQRVITINNQDRLQTVLMHDSGQTLTDDGVPILNTKNDCHGLGSGITYAKRYGLSAMLGIATGDDDDGNAAATPQLDARMSVQNARQQAAPTPNL